MMNLGLVVVETCDANQIHSTALEQFEHENPDVTVLRMDCLNQCGICRSRPYALVNGKVATARTASQCLDKVMKEITTINEEYLVEETALEQQVNRAEKEQQNHDF